MINKSVHVQEHLNNALKQKKKRKLQKCISIHEMLSV